MGRMREQMLKETFWRWAWGVSLALAALVILTICVCWNDIVRVWPAAARLSLPG